MSRRKDGETTGVQFRVYVPQANNIEGDLLYQSFEGVASRPNLAATLIQRGWLNLLHSTTPTERAILIRSLGLPDDVIARIDLMPAPLLYQGPQVAVNEAAIPPAAPAAVPVPAPQAAPVISEPPKAAESSAVATAAETPAPEPSPPAPTEPTGEDQAASPAAPESGKPITARVFALPTSSFMDTGGLL